MFWSNKFRMLSEFVDRQQMSNRGFKARLMLGQREGKKELLTC
jgi:hypothetical protein